MVEPNQINILEFCISLREAKCLPVFPESIKSDAQRNGQTATNSEIIRMIQNGAVEINGEQVREWRAIMKFPVESLVFFPSGKRRTTLR